jgi:hypothetical protein
MMVEILLCGERIGAGRAVESAAFFPAVDAADRHRRGKRLTATAGWADRIIREHAHHVPGEARGHRQAGVLQHLHGGGTLALDAAQKPQPWPLQVLLQAQWQ